MNADPLRNFIRREFLFDKDAPLSDDDALFPEIIDSLGLMDLVEFIEESYEVDIGEDDLVIDNFGTVAAVVRMVEAKQG